MITPGGPPRIDLWLLAEADVDALSDAVDGLSVLTAPEIARMHRLLRPASRRRHLGARLLARFALGRYVGAAPGTLRFGAGPYGRPELPGGPDFNLTHTDGLIGCAVTWQGRIGVDAELAPIRDAALGLVDTVLTPAERRQLAGVSQRAVLLAERWVLKEAYVKALGLGLHRGFDTFEVRADPAGGLGLHDPAGTPSPRDDWQFRLLSHGPHVIGVAHAPADPTTGTARLVCVDAFQVLTGRAAPSGPVAASDRRPLLAA